jgi:hypothetical protein
MSHQNSGNKNKNEQVVYIKLKGSLEQRKQNERQPADLEKILANHRSNKG